MKRAHVIAQPELESINSNESVLEILKNAPPPVPGESDLDACRRIFRGRKYECKLCNDTILWIGICDLCFHDVKSGRRSLYSPRRGRR